MKDVTLAAAVVVFGAMPASYVLAAPSVPNQQQTQNQPTTPQQQAQQTARIPLLPASDIVGRPVVDLNGTNAGRVNSMVIDTKNGVVEYVLIEGRGDFDLNGQLIAAPWSIIQQPRGKGAIGLKVDRKQLDKAPRISSAELNRLGTAGWRTRVYGYYGRPYPYYGSAAWYGYPPAPITANGQDASLRNGMTGQTNGSRGGNAPANAAAANGAARAPNSANATASNGARAANNNNASKTGNNQQQGNGQQENGGNGLSVNNNGVISALMHGSTVAPNQVQSAPIYGQNGTQLGQIDQLLIDTRTGHVAYALVRRGGFLGLNPTWFAVPVEALSWQSNLPGGNGYANGGGVGYGNAGGRRLVVNEQKLQSVPSVPVNQAHLTTYAPRQDLARLYQHFGIKPYWTRNGNQSNASTTGQNAH
ncbi:MAG TPA: PRC-barrel domain-containing protein [Pseudolabrys sp.]|nr:PRC-barrel domain-containing protein [Pseudolabrys sp.]